MEKLQWKTEQRKVNELLKLEINPRKISEAKKAELKQSLEKFNLVDIPVIDFDNTIIAGNQRITVLQLLERGDELIDVRVPNRKLTDKEKKEYILIANTHAGEFDFDILELEFGEIDFEEIGFDFKIEHESFELPEIITGDFEKSKNPNDVYGGNSTPIRIGGLMCYVQDEQLCEKINKFADSIINNYGDGADSQKKKNIIGEKIIQLILENENIILE